MTGALRPTPLEIAVGAVVGDDDRWAERLPQPAARSPRDALEAALLPALLRPPCLVTFSGGRDSSLLLAVAVEVARRHGLEPPVAVTARFAHAPGTGEAEWQELVVGHLGLDAWERLDVDDDLDLIGVVQAPILRRHGVLHPPHTALFALVARRVPCGALVTGFGGDQLGNWIGARLDGPARAAYAVAPQALRRLLLRGKVPDRPWLTTAARAEWTRRWLADAAAEPAGWSGYLARLGGRRTLAALRFSLDAVLSEAGTAAFHPLLEPRLLAALAGLRGRRSRGGREALFRLLAQGALPDPLLARRDKAHFHHAYFRGPSRAFARRWDGCGLDPTLVDAEVLRQAWLARFPRGSSALALQAAWLATEGSEAPEQQVAGLGEEIPAAGAA